MANLALVNHCEMTKQSVLSKQSKLRYCSVIKLSGIDSISIVNVLAIEVRKLMKMFISIGFIMLLSSCSVSSVNPSPENVRLSHNGDCVYIEEHDDELCLVLNEMVEGWVNSSLVVSSSKQSIIETQTYLTSASIEFSPYKKVFMIEVSAEGHPSFGFYDTKTALQANSAIRADFYLNEYYFEHFESIGDNGDVVFSLSEQNGQSCYDLESNSPQVHSPACLVGFNILTKQALAFNQGRPCVLNK